MSENDKIILYLALPMAVIGFATMILGEGFESSFSGSGNVGAGITFFLYIFLVFEIGYKRIYRHGYRLYFYIVMVAPLVSVFIIYFIGFVVSKYANG